MKPRIILFSNGKVMYSVPHLSNDDYYKYNSRLNKIGLEWVAFYKSKGYL